MPRKSVADVIDAETPREFLTALRYQAEGDALAVTEFIEARGFVPSTSDASGKWRGLPSAMMLGVGLALRLRRWELAHIDVHLQAGMLSSEEVFSRIRHSDSNDELSAFVTQVSIQRITVYREHFLWSVHPNELTADIAIVGDADEAFVDAVAEFLIAQMQSNGAPE